MSGTVKIVVAFGDGIGPEIMNATLKIIKEAKVKIEIDTIEIGEKQYKRDIATGIPPSAWETIKNNKVLLKAPITTPQGQGYKSLNVTLRKTLGLYANVRPCKSYHPFVQTNFPNLDLVIIRENEEDLYTGVEYRNTRESFQSLKTITYGGSFRIAKFAFDYALKNNRQNITCMMKDNIMKMTDGLFHRVFDEVATSYKEIKTDQMIVDIGTAKVAADPERFDMILTENLYGDIISDVAAEVSGSVGLGGSANIGNEYAMFEAIHGSAPDIADQDIANPSGLINAAVMMLNHLCMQDKAELIQNALLKTLEDGIHTADLYNASTSKKKVGTQAFADAVIANLGQKPKQLKEANYVNDGEGNHCEDREVPYNPPSEKNKALVGVDVFIDNGTEIVANLAEQIAKFDIELKLDLQKISCKGLKIWPEDGFFESNLSDCLVCRFVSKEEDKIIIHNDIIKLLAEFSSCDMDFVKSENLYLYDNTLGFSL
jgi:isocitrate dehydrogenase